MADGPAGAGVLIRPLPPLAWLSLRVPAASLAVADAVLGAALPQRLGAAHLAEGMRLCCLGPDEWRLLVPEPVEERLRAALLAAGQGFSLVAIGEAERALEIAGPQALRVLAGGCPLDVERMPPGRIARTLFAAVETVLLVTGPLRFELAVARSCFPYLNDLVTRIAAEPAGSAA